MVRRNERTRGRNYSPWESHQLEYRFALQEQKIAELTQHVFQINMQLIEIHTALGHLTKSIMELEAIRDAPPPIFNRRGCVRINVACRDPESSIHQQCRRLWEYCLCVMML